MDLRKMFFSSAIGVIGAVLKAPFVLVFRGYCKARDFMAWLSRWF